MINVPISIGDFVDKISILIIKSEKVQNENKAKNINKELDLLLSMSNFINHKDIEDLKKINLRLWDCENNIRNNPTLKTAIEIAKYNDIRAKLKQEINRKYSSNLTEEKEYESSNNRT